MSEAIPRYLGDPDYYGKRDPRRQAHVERIKKQRRIEARIRASSGDGSYTIVVTKQEAMA